MWHRHPRHYPPPPLPLAPCHGEGRGRGDKAPVGGPGGGQDPAQKEGELVLEEELLVRGPDAREGARPGPGHTGTGEEAGEEGGCVCGVADGAFWDDRAVGWGWYVFRTRVDNHTRRLGLEFQRLIGNPTLEVDDGLHKNAWSGWGGRFLRAV